MAQSYRNSRQGFLTDMLVDTTPIGSIVPNLKTTDNSYDHNFVRSTNPNYGALSETTGNAYLNGDDQHTPMKVTYIVMDLNMKFQIIQCYFRLEIRMEVSKHRY